MLKSIYSSGINRLILIIIKIKYILIYRKLSLKMIFIFTKENLLGDICLINLKLRKSKKIC